MDEYGDATIIIPLGKWNGVEQVNDLLGETDACNCSLTMMSSGARHVHYDDHDHSVYNVRKEAGFFKSDAVTEYAAEGCTITKSYESYATITLDVNIVTGIELKKVKQEFSFAVGGSLSYGESESYQFGPVPEGYRGRIAYRAYFYRNYFDDLITYYVHGTAWEDNYEVQVIETGNYVDGLYTMVTSIWN